MQKKLIALAVAGMVAAPVAMAQSNVTVYGIADAFFSYGKMGDNKRTGIDSGGLAGSRIGFRGTEDLGNGLSAVFTLEYGLNIDQNQGIGTGGLNARQQFVGLQGGFGFVGLGRQYAPGFFALRYDAGAGAPWTPQALLSGASGSTITPASPARWNNSVNYKSPNFGGLTVNAIYSLGEVNQSSNRRDQDRFGLGADYAAGPLAVGVIYHHQKNDPIVGSANNKKEWLLGGSYDFGMVKLLGSYQRDKVSDTNKIWQLGVSAPVGEMGSAYLAYGKLDHGVSSDLDARALSLGYTHAMSKRTKLYAAYTHVNNKSASGIAFNVSGAGEAGSNANTVVLGVNHAF